MAQSMDSITNGLNDPQREAVEHDQGPMLVLAGAGSGKTRVVTSRIIRLLERGVDPHHILAVTFTNKAAGEMRNRVVRATNADVLVSTFHSLGARMLRESIEHLGYRRDFTIYDEEDVDKVLKACCDDMGLAVEKADLKKFRQVISKAKNALQGPDDLNLEMRGMVAARIGSIYRAYAEQLFQYNAVDFDDLLYLPVKLLRECPEVLTYYLQRWHYLLIDEYQDTNAAQYELIRLLVGERHNLCVVGDPDQSIYSWRGAEIRNILDFQQDYPEAKVIRLEQNYRSTTHILDAANALISHNASRYEKNLWSALGAGEKIAHFCGQDDADETRFIASCVRHHRDRDGISLNDMVIFYRTNFQSRVFEDRFLAARIPYVIVGGVSFYQRREVKDIMCYLRMVYSGSDMISFERTVNTPKRGLGAQTVEKIRSAAIAESVAIFDYCRGLVEGRYSHPSLTPKAKTALNGYVELISSLKNKVGVIPLQDLVQAAIDSSGYLQYLEQDDETYDDRKANLKELITKASEWDRENPGGTLSNFLEELSLKANLDDVDTSLPRISLMTIHSGKGLEFPVTFLVGMEEDLFPHINSRDDDVALEEERRLCYVGITRAQRYLYITHARWRNLWGTKRPMSPSRFLREIPKEHIKSASGPITTSLLQREVSEVVDSEEERVVYDEPPKKAANEARMKEGDVVFHREFGIGTIESVYEGGGGLTYKVFFSKDNQRRSLIARYASLSLLK